MTQQYERKSLRVKTYGDVDCCGKCAPTSPLRFSAAEQRTVRVVPPEIHSRHAARGCPAGASLVRGSLSVVSG